MGTSRPAGEKLKGSGGAQKLSVPNLGIEIECSGLTLTGEVLAGGKDVAQKIKIYGV